MHRGYFALWRKVEDHPFYTEPREWSKLEAWIDILKDTQHSRTPKKVVLGMTILECHYGESLKSNITRSKKWNWSEPKVRRFLKLLKKMGQIDFRGEGKTTRIKVINFEQYDPRRRREDDETTNGRRGRDEQTTTDNNANNEKNVNNPPESPQGDEPEPPSPLKTWKTDFEIYLQQCERSFRELIADFDWQYQQERINPNIDIPLSLEKAKVNYWGTKEGWKKKKRAKSQTINWKYTWQNAIAQPMNRVYKDAVQKAQKNQTDESTYNFPTCGGCNAKGTEIRKGEPCPYCKFVN